MRSLDGALEQVKENWAKYSKNTTYERDPVAWAKDYLGIHPWSAQREIMYSVRDNRATAVAAGHGVGKTMIAAVIACWWIDIHPHSSQKTFIASTAPSADQVDLLWDNIRNMHALAQDRYERGLVDHPLPGYINGKNKWMYNGDTLGQGRKPPDNKSDVAFQGRHADYLLAIGDEAVGLSAGFLGALGVIATGQYNRQLLIANPTDPTCAMAKIWREENANWHTMHISVMDSPRITPEADFNVEEWAPGLSGWEFVNQAKDDYDGEDDPRYIARVLGQWAFDSGNNMFTEEELANGRNCYVLPDPESRPMLGLDIARGGKDASVLYRADFGEVWETDENGKPATPTGHRGLKLRYLDSWNKAPLMGGRPDNPSTTERAHQAMMEEGALYLKFDAAGMGQGVIDALAQINEYQQGRHGYIWFEVYGQATTGVDRRQYENARAEQFFKIKTMLHKGELDIDPQDDRLQDELRGVVYEYTSAGRIKIEGKDDMKRRGVKSPDFADAAWYACYDVEPILNAPTEGKFEYDLGEYEVSDRIGGYGPSI